MNLVPVLLAGGLGVGLLLMLSGDALADEKKRMTPKQRQLFNRLMTVETNPAQVGSGAATFNAGGFPQAARALAGRAKSM